jgi:phage shock protein E
MKNLLNTIIITAIALTFLLCTSVSAQELVQYEKFENNVQVIDVRTVAEFKDGHHPDAVHLPHTTILDGKGFDTLDKTNPVVLYCRSGGRAEQAKNYLAAQGFSNVKNLGGINDLLLNKEERK